MSTSLVGGFGFHNKGSRSVGRTFVPDVPHTVGHIGVFLFRFFKENLFVGSASVDLESQFSVSANARIEYI
jgi:hypothetical protein